MKIISYKNFEALNIQTKLQLAGHLIFTKNQLDLIKQLLRYGDSEVTTQELSYEMNKGKRSIASTASSINRKYYESVVSYYYGDSLIEVDQSLWGSETYFDLDQEALKEYLECTYDTYVCDNGLEYSEEEEDQETNQTDMI